MRGIEHDLTVTGGLVGQFDRVKADELLGPMAPIVGGIGVAVHEVCMVCLCLSTLN